jgi:hypothetical protein
MLAETSVLTRNGTKKPPSAGAAMIWRLISVKANAAKAQRSGRAAPAPRLRSKGRTLKATRFIDGVTSRSNVNSIALRSWQTVRSIARNHLIGSWDEDATPPFKKRRGAPPCKCDTRKRGLARRWVTGAGDDRAEFCWSRHSRDPASTSHLAKELGVLRRLCLAGVEEDKGAGVPTVNSSSQIRPASDFARCG